MREIGVRAPWWWPAVDATVWPHVSRLARKVRYREGTIRERTWAVIGVMVDQNFSTDTLAILFPEVRLPEKLPPWGLPQRVVTALGRRRETALAQLAFEELGRVSREGPLPPLPTIAGLSEAYPKRWDSVFSRSRNSRDIFFVRDTHISHTGVDYYKTRREHAAFGAILRVCADFDLVRVSAWTGGTFDASSHEDYVAFLDGGVTSRAGPYHYNRRGARIIGHAALRFLCFQLGLAPPRWLSTSSPAPSNEQLVRQILIQLGTELPVLRQRLREFAKR